MKKLVSTLLSLCLALGMAAPSFALEETIAAPDGPNYGKPTSVDVVYTADGGAAKNEDRSKNAALIPPTFGSPGAYTPNTGEYLTPNLAPGVMAATGATVNGGTETLYPGSYAAIPTVTTSTTAFTDVISDLYYADGSLGTLKIPALGLTVNVYQGTDSTALAKGAGHFGETSIWDGNVALASHNRGASDFFGKIHTLAIGDTVTLTTKLGTRSYAVTSIAKVSETDRGALAASADNRVTLYTCVRNERDYRWCVVASEVV